MKFSRSRNARSRTTRMPKLRKARRTPRFVKGKGLDAIINRIPNKQIRTTKIRKAPLSEVLSEKMTTENLKSHLTSTLTASAAAAVVKEVSPGVVKTAKQLYDAAKDHGGFKKLIPTENDMDMLEESPVFKEDNRVGLDMGSIYKKAIVLTEGMKKDSQMRTANKLYKAQTWPCFNSQSSKYYVTSDVFKVLQSSAGANRQGVWYPENVRIAAGNAWTSPSLIQLNAYITPVLLKMQMYDELRNYWMSQSTVDWLDEPDNVSADIFYGINSITDVITFANAQKYLPVELKIYICKCKTRTKWAPAADWFDPSGNSEAYDRMRDEYIYDSTAVNVINPAAGNQNDFFTESSVHLGATPFYSPTFRMNWDVVDVVKQEINPTDKFELTLHRDFRHAHSIRDLETEWNSMGQKGFYCVGDYALIITFKGLPCIMRYTGDPPTVPAISWDTKEVDASPVRILMTSRSSMSVSAPNKKDSSMEPARGTDPNYISGEGRVLDSKLDTHAYSDTTWVPSVMTNLEEKDGGAR